jgi:MFS family permease
VLSLLISGGVLLLVFLWLESRVPEPMLRLQLFQIRPYSAAVLAALCGFIALGANLYIIPFFLQQLLGYPPEQAGLILLAGPLTLSIVAPVGGFLSDKIGARWIASSGLLIASAGYFAFSYLQADWTWHDVVWRSAAVSLGFGLFQSPNSSSALNSAPLSDRGIASSMIAFMRNLGFVAGISLAAAVWYSLRNQYAVSRSVPPESIAAQVSGMHFAYLVMSGLVLLGAFISLSRGKNQASPAVSISVDSGQTGI